MLDYAANAVVYWPIETLRGEFELRCEREGLDPDIELAAVLGDGGTSETFWEQAAANLKGGRIRLVFVADKIPRELRRVVEFLNEQMTADVIAIEVTQYVGEGLRTLVPRVVGQTAASETRKARVGRQWDEASFFAELEQRRGAAEAAVARDLLEWAKKQMPRFTWGSGKVDGSFIPALDTDGQSYYPIVIYTSGKLYFRLPFLATRPPFDSPELSRELLARLSEIPSVVLPPGKADFGLPTIRIDLSLLAADPAALNSLKGALDWFCERARS
jgi:hypothetical protein